LNKTRLKAFFVLLIFIFATACSQTPSHFTETDAYASVDYSFEPAETESAPGVKPDRTEKPGIMANEETDVTPEPTATPDATPTPEPADTPEPVETQEPADTPEPTKTPEPVKTPKPTKTPKPSKSPKPTETPTATPSPKPESTPAQADAESGQKSDKKEKSSPEPEKKESKKPMGVPESSPVKMSFFDDALFIGDSNTWRLKNFVNNKRKSDKNYMGKASFLCEIGFGLHHALKPLDKTSISVKCDKGQEWEIVEYIKQNNYGKIYIMLGTNDIGLHGVDKSVNNYVKLIKKIKAVTDADIYIQSVPPMGKHKQKKVLNNKNIDQFNKKMYEQSKSLNCYYLDVASCLKDSEGNLPSKYSSDQYVHLSNAAFPLWVDYLRKHTK